MEKKTRTQIFVGERVIGGKCSERTIIVKCCVNVTPTDSYYSYITAILFSSDCPQGLWFPMLDFCPTGS